jgi:hypothetical protein
MNHRALLSALVLCVALCPVLACGDDDKIVDQVDAKNLDKSSTQWDDGPKPTPDPPLVHPGTPDAGTDAAVDMPGADAGSDAGPSDAGASDAAADAA